MKPRIAILCSLFFANSAPALDVFLENDGSVPIVYVNVAVKAGAVTDPEGQSGLTNFMGEMLLRGSQLRNKEKLDLELDQMGAQLEVETRSESMIVRGAVLSAELNHFLRLLHEVLTRPSFPEIEIKKLKSEMISALLQEQGNDHAISQRHFTEFLFMGHPYGKPIVGKIRDIEQLDRRKITRHYDKLIREQNMVLVASGDTDKGTLESWASKLGKDRAGGETIAIVPAPVNAPQKRLQIIDKPERTQTQVQIGQVGALMTDPNYFPLYLGNAAFGGGSFSSRMMVEIRVKRGWSYGAGSAFRYGLKPRSWQAHFSPASKDSSQALGFALELIESLRDKGVTQEEFDLAKESAINGAGFMFNTPKKRVENTLLEKTLRLPDGLMKTYAAELAKVSLSQTNLALKKFLHPDRLAISVLATAKDLKDPLLQAAKTPPSELVVKSYTQD